MKINFQSFFNRKLSPARIRWRTFDFKRKKSILQFRIWRHYNAWKYPENMSIELQVYEFDFENILLKMIE